MSNATEIIVRLIIYHPLAAEHVLAVTGSHWALGDWREPKLMALAPARRLLTGALARCWEFAFPIARESVFDLEYRYLIINQNTGTAVWEREPNRHARFPEVSAPGADSIEIVDANFVGGMEFDAIPPRLFIGPYPQLPEDIDQMKASGVTAVLNLQTDADMRQRRVDWGRLLRHYRMLGIDCRRLPIRDFDEEDLVAQLPAAARLLKHLIDNDRQVYIHCTAGMGRSPAVAVTYLSRYHGKSPAEALAYVKRHRPIICPNVNAVRRALLTKW